VQVREPRAVINLIKSKLNGPETDTVSGPFLMLNITVLHPFPGFVYPCTYTSRHPYTVAEPLLGERGEGSRLLFR